MQETRKLMIVDDEYIVRKGLRKVIDWNEIGITVSGEADNIRDAIEVARRIHPDIVFCDIRLPGGEGFQIIDSIRDMVPWVQFIMITAHSDRQYIKEAIHQQVCDYLFKPASKEDIIAAVSRAKDKIDQYMQELEESNQYHTLLAENMDIIRENFLNNLLHETVSESKIEQSEDRLGILLKGPLYQLICVRMTEGTEAEMALSTYLRDYVPQISEDNKHPGWLFAIVNLNPKIQSPVSEDQIRHRFNWQEVYASGIIERLAELPPLYMHFEKSYFDADNIQHKELDQVKNLVVNAVRYRDDPKEVRNLFTQYKDKMTKFGYSEQAIQSECIHLLNALFETAGIPYQKESGNIDKAADDLCDKLSIKKREGIGIAERAIYHIKKHYMEDLSLEQTAAELFLSAAYLSRVVKEQTGHGFSYWLNYYRVEAAKRLLNSSDDTVEQIAEKCGYHSYRIFSENFKKYSGITASDWRTNRP